MDVRCTRCGTEYEFDDALISERGTSVRCTQCGHQFRVYPPKAKAVGPDEWVVLTSLGRRIVYRSLRELQNGIARGEVAREDLLARGSAPPRPLGSIAELDPLFTTKSAPERKSSTLTGVAPPPVPSAPSSADDAGAKQDPPDLSAGLREHQDTWSGVAPPPQAKELAELAVNPSPPMRVGGARTVIGIGSPIAVPTREPPMPMRAPDGSSGAAPSLIPDTRAFGSTHSSGGQSRLEDSAQARPEPTATDSEPPTLPPPPSPRATDQTPVGIRERAGTKLGIGGDAARSRLLEMAPNTIAPQAPDELPKDAFATLLGKGAGVPEFLKEPAATTTGVSEPPTVRVPEHPTDMPPVSDLAEAMVTEAKVTEAKVTEAKSGEVRAAGATPISGAADAANLSSDGSNESTGASASAESLAISEPLANAIPGVVTGRLDHSRPRRSKSQASTPDVNPGSPSKPRAQTDAARSVAQAAEAARPDSPTRPPSRPHRAQVQPATGAKFPWAAILLGILVLGGGVYAGIKIVGMKLDGTRRVPTPAVAEPTLATGPSPSGTTGATANAFTAVDEALEAGDIELAKAQLGDVPSEERASHDYRRLEILIEAMQIDLLWWQVRLAGGSEPSPADITADRVQARLGDLEAKLSSCRASKECKSATQPAYWALWRMRGQVELAERPTQGTVDANGLYQLAMLDWGKAGKVEPKILEKLRKARLAGVEQGPRVTALIVALIDLGRFDDARAELANLASAPKAHPHLAALNRYLRAKENSVDAGALDAGVLDGESSHGGRDGDNGDLDLALNEPDFRVRLQRAVQSLSRNELTKAQKLLRSVLAERPNDTEAITAMGDVHLRRGDLGQARTAYERALALNGSYLPAMAGAADVRWRSGDRANAVALYRRIVDRVGEGPGYGQTAASRIKEHEGVKAPEGAGEPARPTGDAPRNGQ